MAFPERTQVANVGGKISTGVPALSLAGILPSLGGAFGWLTHRGLLQGRVHPVVAGKAYRSGQLRPEQLARVLEKHGIRTVVSLRGGGADNEWFREQGVVCARHNASLYGISFSARQLPRPRRLRRLLRIFRLAPGPLLFHCRGGADRSGMAAALYLHLHGGLSLEEARRAGLSWRFGHVPAQAAPMGEFFDLYHATNDGLSLDEWILREYPAHFQRLCGDGKLS